VPITPISKTLSCNITSFNALLDTGSNISVLPYTFFCNPIIQSKSKFQTAIAANNTEISLYGTTVFSFYINETPFEWTFYIADVTQPILGNDFMKHFQLHIDFCNDIVFSKSHFVSNLTDISQDFSIIHQLTSSSKFDNLFKSFNFLFTKPNFFTDSSQSLNEHRHTISVTQTPKYKKPYQLPLHQREEARKLIDEMLSAKIIEPSTSPFASPLLLRKKRDGTLRPVVDYRELNKVTEFDPYPLPTIKDLLNDLSTAKYFAVLDLHSGFWQIPMHERDKGKTTMTTPFGAFQYCRMPFGLRNSA